MGKLTFDNGLYERVLAKDVTLEESHVLISDFLKEHNYNYVYWRSWFNTEKKATQFDVGSWSQFFYFYED